jgi:hypothetical protein
MKENWAGSGSEEVSKGIWMGGNQGRKTEDTIKPKHEAKMVVTAK